MPLSFFCYQTSFLLVAKDCIVGLLYQSYQASKSFSVPEASIFSTCLSLGINIKDQINHIQNTQTQKEKIYKCPKLKPSDCCGFEHY